MRKQHTFAAGFAVLAVVWVGSLAPAGEKDAKERLREDPVWRELVELGKEIADLRSSVLEARVDLRAINRLLEAMEKALERTGMPSTSMRPAISFDPTAPLATGTIRLDNRLGVR